MTAGQSRLNLGCGTEQPASAWNVDAEPACDPDQVVNLGECPWPWADGRWQSIQAAHVFEHLERPEQALRECARILAPGGTLTVTVPMGLDARADPDHEHVWTWRTPEFYTGARHWDADVGLEVVGRTVDLWSHHPSEWMRRLHHWYWERCRDQFGDGAWCFALPNMSGEFTVVFEKP